MTSFPFCTLRNARRRSPRRRRSSKKILIRSCTDGLLRALDAGADVNELTFWGLLLARAIHQFEAHSQLHQVVAALIARGAEPTRITPDRDGPLFSAVILRDAEVVRLLLEAGAQPNAEWDGSESLYDWALFDYLYETYRLDLPEEPSPQDRESPRGVSPIPRAPRHCSLHPSARLPPIASRRRREDRARAGGIDERVRTLRRRTHR